MYGTPSERIRRRVGYALLVLLSLGMVWYFSPGLPVWIGPWATAKTKAEGKALFEHEWQPNDELASGDGLGPVYNATSCVACHFQGGVGGGGHNKHNVLAFETKPTKSEPEVQSGLVHHFAADPGYRESTELLKSLHPILKGRSKTINYCGSPRTVPLPDFDPIRTESINTTALFGAGWIDRISNKAITHNRTRRMLENTVKEFELDFSSIPAGRARLLGIGKVGKFGWKAQFSSLKEFVAAACANELGLGNPVMPQAKPLGKTDYPDQEPDLTRRQFKALVAFIDTLPQPVQVLPDDPADQAHAARGKELFMSVGCAVCHTPDVGGVKGVYSDFLLHRIRSPEGKNDGYDDESPEEPLPTEHPKPDEWKTPPLWGVADSAPYFHDGGSPTLKDAILRHGADGTKVTNAYKRLPDKDQQAIVAFLMTLKAPPDAHPVTGPADQRLAQR